MEKILLNSGTYMPMIGLGTADPMHDVKAPDWVNGRFNFITRIFCRLFITKLWRILRSYKLSLSVKIALQYGYTVIDTSSAYRNEHLIRRGIRWSGVPREKVFLITRVSNQQQWEGDIRGALMRSLRDLGTTYIDLYMFHWPVPDAFEQTWKEMEILHREGLVRAIGVANCHQHHLEKLLAFATIVPVVNEFEIHPLFSQNELVQFCTSIGITPIAYTPIGRFHEKLAKNTVLLSLADKYNKSIPQIILRWHIQRGIPAIPRSLKAKNIKANIDIFDFDLDSNEILMIDSINENLRLRFDPDNCDFTKL